MLLLRLVLLLLACLDPQCVAVSDARARVHG